MNTTYMNSLLEDLKGRVERATLRGSNISLFPETVAALLAELERLQAENAALRADKARLNEQLERVNFVAAARAKDLQTLMESRPDAAPVETAPRRPRLGDTFKNAIVVGARVRIKESGEYAHVTKIKSGADDKRIYVVTCEDFTGTVYALPKDDIELAPVEPPAREIAVGDRVLITSGFGAGLVGIVSTLERGDYYRVAIYQSDRVLYVPMEQVERIEPA